MSIEILQENRPVKTPCFKCLDQKYILNNFNSGKIPCPMCNGIKNEAGQMPAYKAIWPKNDMQILNEKIDALEKDNQEFKRERQAIEESRVKHMLLEKHNYLERIEKLESEQKTSEQVNIDSMSSMNQKIEQLRQDYRTCYVERIKEGEKNIDSLIEVNKSLIERMEKIESTAKFDIIDHANYREIMAEIGQLKERLNSFDCKKEILAVEKHYDSWVDKIADRLEKIENLGITEDFKESQNNVNLGMLKRIKSLEDKSAIYNDEIIKAQLVPGDYDCYKEHEKNSNVKITNLTLIEAINAIQEGKFVRRKAWDIRGFINRSKILKENTIFTLDDLTINDWEITENENLFNY